MPWQAQKCPFCPKKYANKKGLIDHLLGYTGQIRWPADGIHDVLKIQSLPIMKAYFTKENAETSYRCPSCQRVIDVQYQFIEHVVLRRHYKDEGSKEDAMSKGNFNPKPYRVWKRKGAFPFLRLPPELRDMVYKELLCFDRIQFFETTDSPCTLKRGAWLQQNPTNNPLALLIANIQVYHEASRIFYRYNTFSFDYREAIPVFLIGIGQRNASLLQSIEWLNNSGMSESCTDIVKSAITQSPASELNIWNDDGQYLKILVAVRSSLPFNGYRPVRLSDEDQSKDKYRYRHTTKVQYYDRNGLKQRGDIAYTLIRQRIDNEDPVYKALLPDFRTIRDERWKSRN
ncbi:hypothetical protein BJX99DRAFT_221156 [Aspergillus californicus]